jgi:dephospho-CoA kinase
MFLAPFMVLCLFFMGIPVRKFVHLHLNNRRIPNYTFQVSRLEGIQVISTIFSVGFLVLLSYIEPGLSWFLVGCLSLYFGSRLSIIGLTGNIGAGKSTASSYMRSELGIEVIDADKIAHSIVAPGSPAFREIISSFGTDVIDTRTGQLNRSALGRAVFADLSKKRILESITHPRILRAICYDILLGKIRGKRIVLDAPLLFESSLLFLMCYETILIEISPKTQLERLLRRHPELKENEIRQRINSQMPQEEKEKLADYVLNNDSQEENLYKKLDELFRL